MSNPKAKSTPFVRSALKEVNEGLKFLGVHPKEAVDNLSGLSDYLGDLRQIRAQLKGNDDFPITKYAPVLQDKVVESGTASGHYFHQDLWMAQRVFANKSVHHVDVGSRVDGFVAHIATFREILVYDIRPLENKVKNIRFAQCDLMQLPDDLIGSTDSLSCLHTIEHFGLGRYGDPIDAYGHLKGLDSLHRMIQIGGKFYFSTPIGPQRIEFNANRIFSIQYLLDWFTPRFQIDRFAYVNDAGDLVTDAPLTPENIAANFGCQQGCGLFEMTKL